MNISFDQSRNEYILGETRYSKSRFISYIESDMLMNALKEKNSIFEITGNKHDGIRRTGGKNILLYGVPGVGKSFTIAREYCNDSRYMTRVVFHPDYTYTDFVGQILPRVKKFEDGSTKLVYAFVPGPFTQVLKEAWHDPDNDYFLVIEEINRGNAPAIFGEIFQLLDRKDSVNYPPESLGESEYSITNYDISVEVFGDENHDIHIPSNMYILATMNTADQNVFTLDTAFQRRWEMRQVENRIWEAGHANDKIERSNITWGAFSTVINEKILETYSDIVSSEDKRLGAYFAKKSELNQAVFSEKVLKYLWDDVFKLDRDIVFSSELNSLEKVIYQFKNCGTDSIAAVLNVDLFEKMQELSV